MRVHLIAVCGTGMGALAGLFKAAGHDVSGSDKAFHPPMGPALEQWGIRLLENYDPAHLDPAPDLVIVGNSCRPDNPEAKTAIERGLNVRSMPHALAEYMLAGRTPLVVAGTHGKTTTSAMCSWILHDTGRDPGFLIGGLPKNFPTSFKLPEQREKKLPLFNDADSLKPLRGAPFVVEGDEYDTAFFEKTPKFWHYKPEVGIITSIEHDHVDIYPNPDLYFNTFIGFIERIPSNGLIVAAAADPKVVELVQKHKRPETETAYFALEGDDTHGQAPHWLAAPASADESGQSFDVYAGGMYAGRAAISVPGLHNVRNAIAAIAATAQGYGVPLHQVIPALSRFSGVRRRQDLLYEIRSVRVYDDFAHHPTAVDETLRAIRTKHPAHRLWAVFEPRSATACRTLHQDLYAHAFSAADRVIFAPVGRPDIPEAERLDTARLARELNAQHIQAETAPSVDAIVETIAKEAAPGDTILLLSNGAFGGIYEKLREALSR